MDENRGTGHVEPKTTSDAWDDFELRLAAYLSTMSDPGEDDHLLVEMPGDLPDGCAPYVQFAAFGDGDWIRAEVSGNHYLAPAFQLGAGDLAALARLGWSGGDEDEPNHFLHRPVASARDLAAVVTQVLRDVLTIPDPGLLAVRAWGPAALGVAILRLAGSDEVPADVIDTGAATAPPSTAGTVHPKNAEQLSNTIAADFRDWFEVEPTIDDDGDFVLPHMDQPVFVRPRKDMPAVEIMARVAHDVHSRRATAVEIGLLNRDHEWIKWTLRGRDVWQTLLVPANPFTPEHLRTMVALFMQAMSQTRDDLALRVGGKVS